jgi:hypothetical protein
MVSISFITNDIIPIYSEIYESDELENTIINIVDNGCNAEKGGFGNGQGSSNYLQIKFLKTTNVLQSKQYIQA